MLRTLPGIMEILNRYFLLLSLSFSTFFLTAYQYSMVWSIHHLFNLSLKMDGHFVSLLFTFQRGSGNSPGHAPVSLCCACVTKLCPVGLGPHQIVNQVGDGLACARDGLFFTWVCCKVKLHSASFMVPLGAKNIEAKGIKIGVLDVPQCHYFDRYKGIALLFSAPRGALLRTSEAMLHLGAHRDLNAIKWVCHLPRHRNKYMFREECKGRHSLNVQQRWAPGVRVFLWLSVVC